MGSHCSLFVGQSQSEDLSLHEVGHDALPGAPCALLWAHPWRSSENPILWLFGHCHCQSKKWVNSPALHGMTSDQLDKYYWTEHSECPFKIFCYHRKYLGNCSKPRPSKWARGPLPRPAPSQCPALQLAHPVSEKNSPQIRISFLFRVEPCPYLYIDLGVCWPVGESLEALANLIVR